MPKILGEASRGGPIFFLLGGEWGKGEGVCENGIFKKNSFVPIMFSYDVPRECSQ